jgi:FkbM family methyltransferase
MISKILDLFPGSRHIVHARTTRWFFSKLLGAFPIRKKLPGSGVQVLIRDLENFYTVEEIFHREVYQEAFREPVRTFIDLGANCGYFSCYAAHKARLRGEGVLGLAVEANPYLIETIRENLSLNQLRDIHAIHAMAGRKDHQETGTLQISDSHTSSSQFGTHPQGKWKAFGQSIQVPYISLRETWQQRFGQEQVDLLKVDIEGSELLLFQEADNILPLCQNVVVEVHKWLVDRDEIVQILGRHGLRYEKSLEENEWFETAIFRRSEG